MADLIGQMLGQYQIIEQIGMGGAPEFSPVHSIAVTDQAIWFGVWYEGLYRYDRAGWYNLEREGTGTTIIHRLHRTTDGALWVLTDNGIARLVGDPFTLD
jgi:ligand-binding sensor domain-containing protein